MPISSSSEKLCQKLKMKKYLEELTVLVRHPVKSADLGSVEQAASIREAAKKLSVSDAASSEITFVDRSSERFKKFVRCLHDANPSQVYVWTPRTIDCGVLLVPSLSAIDFDFDFAVNEEGILVFLTDDLEDRLLLDFFILPADEKRMKIETQGANWGKVIY